MSDEQKVIREYNKLTQKVLKKCGPKFMWSDVLEKCGEDLIGPSFKGVFPRDGLDYSTLRNGQTALINTQPAGSSGEHWAGVGCNSRNQIVVYDSFGRKGAGLLHIPGAIDTDLDAEQREEEVNCGPRSIAWCIIFARDQNAAMLI